MIGVGLDVRVTERRNNITDIGLDVRVMEREHRVRY